MTRKLDHIGIIVDDLEQALVFWRDALGLALHEIEELPERGLRIAMLALGDTRIELISATRDDSEISAALAKRGPGLHHLCVRSDDVQQDLDALDKRGVRLINRSAKPGAGGAQVAFVHPKSTGGVLLELSQPGAKVFLPHDSQQRP